MFPRKVSGGERAKKNLVYHAAGPQKFALSSDSAGNQSLEVPLNGM